MPKPKTMYPAHMASMNRPASTTRGNPPQPARIAPPIEHPPHAMAIFVFSLETGWITGFYRDQQEKLAVAQRARNKKRVKAIHAKIANRRKDALHKFSRELVNRSGEIYVGNVKSSSLTSTRMAKSVLDAGWAMLKTMLSYKCDHAGIVFKEVNESYTTQTCSNCGALPDSRPRGIAGLGIREWVCSECGVAHDRDINAAKNILAVGHGRPVVGIRH